MNVLLVEDDVLIRMDLESRLRLAGANVVAASATGMGAVQSAREHMPDLILMDIKLKGDMNGIEAANLIARFLVCCIVFISSYDRQDPGETLSNSECKVGYFSKPISNETLKEILTEYASLK